MSEKSRAGQKATKSGTARRRTSRLEGSAVLSKNPKRRRQAAKGRRLHPPPEEDLGGGDICSLEERPSTEDNMPIVAHVEVTDPPREVELEEYDPKRSLVPVAIALAAAVFGALSLFIADHGLSNRSYVESPRAHAASEAAAEADGALIIPTRRPSLYSRTVRQLR